MDLDGITPGVVVVRRVPQVEWSSRSHQDTNSVPYPQPDPPFRTTVVPRRQLSVLWRSNFRKVSGYLYRTRTFCFVLFYLTEVYTLLSHFNFHPQINL